MSVMCDGCQLPLKVVKHGLLTRSFIFLLGILLNNVDNSHFKNVIFTFKGGLT